MFRKQVYSSDVQPKVVEEAKNITYSQSKKVNTQHRRKLDPSYVF